MKQESLLFKDGKEKGWVRLWRKILENPIIKDAEALQLFVYCLLKATHRDIEVVVNHQIVRLERGEFIFGLHQASRDLKMSIKKLRNRLIILQNLQILARKTASKFSIISIYNYEYYQDSKNEEGQAKGQAGGKQRATYNNNRTKEDINNGSSGKKTPDPKIKDFFTYWGETFLQETGQPYTFSYGKEGRLVKDLLKVHSLETLQEVTRAFFKDEQCKRRGLTIGIFFQEINRLLSVKAMNPLEQAKREQRAREGVTA